MLGKDKCSRPFRRFLLLFPCLLIVLFGIGFSQQAFEEYKAKSAFIYKLCKFIQWPPSETNSPTSPLVISVMGKLPRGNKIEISSEKRIGERKIVIKSIKHLDEIGGSQVLFIAPSEARRVVDIIAWVNGKAILTIGDTKEFGAKGVIINFFITKQESMGFEINREASQKARLKIPSQLFAIGKLVKTDPPPLQAKKMGEQEK